MKRRINRAAVIEWRERVGGQAEALKLVMDCLKCSPSKADKVASGHYPSVPSALERKALCQLMGVEESTLFVPVTAGAKNRAS
jgi:hypothetical protein